MVNPPAPGDASFESYTSEVDSIYESLRRRAKRLADALNKMEGVSCNDPEGAMYVFPQIRLSKSAVEAAAAAKQQPDVFYSLAMLDATGVVRIGKTKWKARKGHKSFDALSSPLVVGARTVRPDVYQRCARSAAAR